MATCLADVIEAQLGRAIAEKGMASLAVSGGSTPATLYEVLSHRNIDWDCVNVLLVDERWVAPGEEGSNETFVRQTLLQNKARSAKLFGLWQNNTPPQNAANQLSIALHAQFHACDALVLGMGNDGHTASWFPCATGLDTALTTSSLLSAIRAEASDVVGKYRDRVTMSLTAVKQAKFLCLVMSGEAKKATFETAHQANDVSEMPVRAILKARSDMWCCWAQ